MRIHPVSRAIVADDDLRARLVAAGQRGDSAEITRITDQLAKAGVIRARNDGSKFNSVADAQRDRRSHS